MCLITLLVTKPSMDVCNIPDQDYFFQLDRNMRLPPDLLYLYLQSWVLTCLLPGMTMTRICQKNRVSFSSLSFFFLLRAHIFIHVVSTQCTSRLHPSCNTKAKQFLLQNSLAGNTTKC